MEQSQFNTNISDSEISLKEVILKMKEWWHYLLSQWRFILIAGFIGGALGVVYSFVKKPIYTAELTFALEEDSGGGGLGLYAGLASQFGIDLGGGAGGAFSGDNIIELMKSRSMVQKALLSPINIKGRNETLADYFIDFNELKEDWKKEPLLQNVQFPLNADPSKFTRTQDSLLGEFHKIFIKKNLSVSKVDKKLSIISVQCSFTNEMFAKVFTEALVNNVTDFYVKTKTGRSKKNVAILQEKADSLRNELDKSIYGRALIIDKTPNLNPVRQVVAVGSQQKEVDIQVLGTAYGEVVKNLEISKMALTRETPFIQIIDVPIMPLEEEKVGKLKGFVLGCILSVFFTLIYLLFRGASKSIQK
ncbi:lipopolysaccharide biosynthesis protein [Solitalea longa]|uniref:Lipopolysaccharide biosynthesis protein n=1 Tax=Solitalea longa TaxID=2079460 RepID=A0A2S5A9P9_9SPHI|nr:Wzz/FepE/Etk N-terminal domain-containing protein [Solitalea longa]POY39246.1 lipopolysaccharide biosynthesis protein [Solitalea longa]